MKTKLYRYRFYSDKKVLYRETYEVKECPKTYILSSHARIPKEDVETNRIDGWSWCRSFWSAEKNDEKARKIFAEDVLRQKKNCEEELERQRKEIESLDEKFKLLESGEIKMEVVEDDEI